MSFLLFVFLFIVTLKTRLFLASVILISLIALISGNVWPFIVVAWFLVSSASLGYLILLAVRIDEPVTKALSAFLIGAGTYATFIGLIAHFPINYPGLYGFLLILPLFFSKRFLGFHVTLIHYNLRKRSTEPSWLSVAALVLFLFYLLIALLPELGCDAFITHLFVPTQLEQRHQWGFNPELYSYALLPMLGDWIYAIVNMLGGETAARLLNVGFILITALLSRQLVLWGGGTEKGAKWTILLLLSTPLMLTEVTSLSIDSLWSAYLLCGLLVLFRFVFHEHDNVNLLKFAGILLGMAAAVQSITFVYLPLCLLLFFSGWKNWLFTHKRAVVLTLSLFLAFGAVPYVSSWIISGNPVFPYYNEVFKSPYYPLINFNNPLFTSGFSWKLPYEMLIAPNKYLEASFGASGFQWLLLLLPSLICLSFQKQYRGLLLLLCGILSVAFTFHFQSYLLYLYPSFVLLLSSIGIALSSQNRPIIITKALSAMTIIAIVLNILFLPAGTLAYRVIPFKAIGDQDAKEQFMRSHLPIRQAIDVVNSLNTDHSPVAIFSQSCGSGLNADVLYPTWYNCRFRDAVRMLDTPGSFVSLLLKYHASYVLLDSHWENSKQRELIEKATTQIVKIGTISIRTIAKTASNGDANNSTERKELLYTIEMLKNPDLTSMDGWLLAKGTHYDPKEHTVRVTLTSNAIQGVEVQGEKVYLNTIIARSFLEPTQGRIQINWYDEKGDFIKASIKVFDSTNSWTEHSMYALSPPKATKAVVYISGHTSTPLEFKSDSLRR
jgi:hypothetical protein